jgi:hypothetical protein
MKHTQGPWEAGTNGYKGWNFTGGYNGTIIAENGEEIYAGPASFGALRGKTEEQAEANAKLIAAAPELLEALKIQVEQFWLGFPEEKYRESFRKSFPDHNIVKAEAAITKATL